MGKRSDFERIERDAYFTPPEAVRFLAPFLPETFTFCEPCAGDGRLIRHLEALGGRCVAAYDIAPQGPGIERGDARHLLGAHLHGADLLVTNPPWERPLLHAMIARFSRLGLPVWLLFDAAWAFTDKGALFMDGRASRNVIRNIVAIGRVKWIEGSSDTGKDDAAWYEIGGPTSEPTRFYGRLDVS